MEIDEMGKIIGRIKELKKIQRKLINSLKKEKRLTVGKIILISEELKENLVKLSQLKNMLWE